MRVLLAAALLSGCVAHQSWSRRDIAFEAAFLVVDAVDFHQTMRITAHGEEQNPIIGAYGQRVSPIVWFPMTAFIHYIVVDQLPASQRGWVLGASVGIEADVVYRNRLDGEGM